MNKNQFDFQKLDFTHEQINGMLKLLYKAYIDDEDTSHKPDLSFLTVEQYDILLNKGFENLSTFDQDYNKLNNLPDIPKIIEDQMPILDIETKGHTAEVFNTLQTNYTEILRLAINDLREEIAIIEERLRDELQTDINNKHAEVTARLNQFAEDLRLSNQTIERIESTLTESINNVNNTLSESIGKNREAIDDNLAAILALMDVTEVLKNVDAELTNKIDENTATILDLVETTEELNNADIELSNKIDENVATINDRITALEKRPIGSGGTGGAGMTEEEKQLLEYMSTQIDNKFDKVTAGKVLDEEGNELTELTFYSGDNVLQSIRFAGGSGGGGSIAGGTLTTSMDAYSSISEKDPVIVPYSFTSPNYGPATLYVTVVNGASSKDIEYPVKKQGAGSINLGILTKGINVISMYVVDSLSKMTNIVEVTVVVGALEISSTFDDGKDFESYNAINIPINVSPIDATETMMASITIDDKVFEQQVYDGFNNFAIPEEVKTAGVHKVVVQVTSEKFSSNKLEYNIVIIDKTMLLLSTKQSKIELEEGYNLNIEYRISTGYTSNYKAQYLINGEQHSVADVQLGMNTFVVSYRDLAIGDYTVKIIVKTGDDFLTGELEIPVKIKGTTFKRIEHVKPGLEVYFDMSTKTNSDSDRDVLRSLVPTSSGQYAQIKLHDYNYATNGWLNGRLVNNGKAWAEIENYLPLENNVLDGFTFDILFKNNNTGINEARVVDCTGPDNPYIGFYIDSEKAVATTDANQNVSYYTDRTDMRITFVVNRTSTFFEEYIIDPETGHSILNPNPTWKPNPMIQTYVDGIFTDVKMLSDSGSGVNKVYESFMNRETILINTDKMKEVFGNNEIKSIRIYNRPLEHEEVLQNYMADYDDLMEQKAIYDKNYVTVNSDIPTLNFFDTDIGKCDLMTKDNKQWINIVYTSPNKDLYGESFDLMGQCQWQGTSSLAYPVKNYKFKLYDWARDENGDIIEALRNDKNSYTKKKINLYPADGNGHKENVFCLKVDYMDSSHCRNTGTARLVNDFLFDGHPNPAKQIDPTTRDTINGFPCQIYINGKWIGLCNFNHDKSCTKTLGLETIEHTVRWEIKANSDSSAGAFINTWGTDIDKCYKDILADFEIVYDEDAFEEKTGEYDITKYYDELGFAHDGAVTGSYYDYAILSLARFVNFVSEADEETYKAKSHEYFDVVQACRYYLNTMTLGMIDNFAKNCIINMYGDDIWWFSFYDMDSSLGLDNTGYNKFDCNIEPSQPGIYNCSTSRMWVKLNDWHQEDLFNEFKTIREGKYTYENICKYLINKQIDVIPPILYNRDMYTKYISQGRQYLHMLHGNNKDHLKRWLYNRFQYVDSLFLQHNSPYTKQNITIRSCAPANAIPKLDESGKVISPYTARFEIQTYSPQYVTVCWRKNTFETKRIDWGETVVFENDMVNVQDNELIIYCATNLKSIGDCTGLNPTTADIGAANRLIEFKCENSDKLLKVDISKNTYLNKIELNGCSALGTIGGGNVLDISNSTNLKEVDIRGTKLTAVVTNPNGGNLQKILFPDAIQNITLDNQVNLEVVGIPYVDEQATAKNLATFSISNCNAIKSLRYPLSDNEEENLTFGPLKYVQYLTVNNSLNQMTGMNFEGFEKLRTVDITNMPFIENIDFINLLPAEAVSTFERITLANIPKVDKVSFNVTSDDYKIAFVNGATIDMGALNIKTLESNTGIQGAKKLILPVGLQELKFTTDYGNYAGDIENIWSFSAVHTNDGFKGMDLKDMNLTHIDMTGLPQITNAINFNITPSTQNPNLNIARDGSAAKPYFRPEGSITLNGYGGSMVGLLKGVDLGKLQVNIGGLKVQDDLTSLFEGAIIPANKLDKVNEILACFTNASKWDKMFKGAQLNGITPDQINYPTDMRMSLKGMFAESDITKDIEVRDNFYHVDEMFMKCMGLTTLTPNWEKEYDYPITTSGCYYGCTNSYLDDVPAEWGGYGFNEQTTGIYVFEIPNDDYTLQITNNENLIFAGGYVNWGDGTPVTQLKDGVYHHIYKKAGRYEVKAKCVPGGYTVPLTSRDTLVEVKQLPTNAHNFNSCFSGAKNLQKVTARNLVFSNNGIKGMFYNCSSLKEIVGIETWDVSEVSDLGSVFGNCSALEYANVKDWDTGNCSNFFNLFFNCKNLKDLDVSQWNTKNAINMQTMFSGCESLTSLDLEKWTTPKITFMNSMFSGCTNLEEIININNITTDKVTLMNSMFSKCKSLGSLDLSSFNAGATTNMDYIFQECDSLTNLIAMTNIKENISVENSIDLTVDSMMSIINNLVDIAEIEEWMATLPSKDQEPLPLSRVFKVGPNNLVKLSPTQIKVATDKGWSVA